MKSFNRYWRAAMALGATLASRPALAGPSTTAFGQAVADLQASPNDLALRQKIIDLSLEMTSLPRDPEDVAVLRGKASFIAKNANSSQDFRGAVEAYSKATLLAPWDGDLYYNLGAMEEKAELPEQASRDFRLYLRAKPDAPDHDKVLARLGKLEVLTEQKKQALQNAIVAQQNKVVSAKAHDKWETRNIAATVVLAVGVVALVGGAVELSLGYVDETSAGYTVAPGSQNGVLYNKPYEGKYWSNDSYSQRTSGESEFQLGEILAGAGLVAVIVGALLVPDPFENPAAVGAQDGNVVWGAPSVALNARGGGLHTTLLSARF